MAPRFISTPRPAPRRPNIGEAQGNTCLRRDSCLRCDGAGSGGAMIPLAEASTRNTAAPEAKMSRGPIRNGAFAQALPGTPIEAAEFRCSRCSECSPPRKPAEDLVLATEYCGTPPLVAKCSKCSRRVDFAAINTAALRNFPALLARWLPDGRVMGREYEARNPRRVDHHPGSFRINLRTGRWADFATGDRGGDVVSLAAFLFGLTQAEAARRLANMLGVR